MGSRPYVYYYTVPEGQGKHLEGKEGLYHTYSTLYTLATT